MTIVSLCLFSPRTARHPVCTTQINCCSVSNESVKHMNGIKRTTRTVRGNYCIYIMTNHSFSLSQIYPSPAWYYWQGEVDNIHTDTLWCHQFPWQEYQANSCKSYKSSSIFIPMISTLFNLHQFVTSDINKRLYYYIIIYYIIFIYIIMLKGLKPTITKVL